MQRLAYLFPGQGAQYVGMGKSFYQQFPEARHIFEQADDIVHRKLSDDIFHGPESALTETRTAQPAIFVTSWAILSVLTHLFDLPLPACTAGLSLGEYTALAASGRIPFEELLPLVDLRGRCMHDACERTEGSMLAVLGLSDDLVRTMVEQINLPNDLWCANFNCPGQVVLSGTSVGIRQAEQAAREYGAKKTIPLQVHGAFHSGLMKGAEEQLSPILRTLALTNSTVPIAMNVSGLRVDNTEQIRHNLAAQITSSVLWHQCISACEATPADLFLEIGCGKTLAGLNKRIGVQIPTVSVETVQDVITLEKFFGRSQ